MPRFYILKAVLIIMISFTVGNSVFAENKVPLNADGETTGVLGANESLNIETSPIGEAETTGIMGANEKLNTDNSQQTKGNGIIGDTETTGIMGANEKVGSRDPSIIGDIETTGTPASNQVLLFENLTKDTLDKKEYNNLENKINTYLEKIE